MPKLNPTKPTLMFNGDEIPMDSEPNFPPPHKYERRLDVIKDLEDNTLSVWPTTNRAKKESVAIQISNDGALGRGCLRTLRPNENFTRLTDDLPKITHED